jgi:hypothetical protein
MAGIPISSKIISENPELERFREVVELLERSTFKTLFPKKWEVSAISWGVQVAHDLLKADPTVSLKETMTAVLNRSNDGLSGEVLMKITEKVIAKWEEKHQAAVPQLAREAEFA